MHQQTHTTDRLAVARAIEADRQRRAQEYRTGRQFRPSRRVPVPAFLVALVVAAGVIGAGLFDEPSPEIAADAYSLHAERTPGLVDGWLDPTEARADAVALPDRRIAGLADGWFDPDRATAEASTLALAEGGVDDLRLHDRRIPGLPDGGHELDTRSATTTGPATDSPMTYR